MFFRARAGTVIGLATNISCLLSTLVQPYMPDVSTTIRTQLNAPKDTNVIPDQFVRLLPKGHKIGTVNKLHYHLIPSTGITSLVQSTVPIIQ